MIDVTEAGPVSRTGTGVRLERRLAATPERVWAAWTDPQRLGRWLAPLERGAPGPDATFVLRMTPDETVTCTVTRWEPPAELELRWDYAGEASSRLRLGLAALADGGTLLVLEHDRLPAVSAQVDYAAGWYTHLAGLSAHLQGTPAPDFDPTIRAAHAAFHRLFAEPSDSTTSDATTSGSMTSDAGAIEVALAETGGAHGVR